MKVLVDGTVFQNNYGLGIQRYFRGMLGRLAARHQISIWNEYPALAEMPDQCHQIGPDLHRPIKRWELVARAKRAALRSKRSAMWPTFDLFCSTYYTRAPHPKLPELVVVHDMIYEQFVWSIEGAEAAVATKRDAILNARICLCVSQTTAEELKTFHPQVADRVRVAYPGCEHLSVAMQESTGERRLADEPYVLFVGARRYYKNFQTVLTAMELPEWPREVKLAVVGKPLLPGELLTLQRLRLTDRVVYFGELSDAQLAHAYKHSLGFLFPSLQEGFGFPSLEAQCCGTPVLCSDIPVFREISADAAIYFNPWMAESIAGAVRKVLDADVRKQLCARGMENVKRFSWERCARESAAAFEEAIG